MQSCNMCKSKLFLALLISRPHPLSAESLEPIFHYFVVFLVGDCSYLTGTTLSKFCFI
ncbi:hypothetical protein AAZV13_05G026600 [Glycine max]